jgi:hypothetical protein
MKEVHMPLIQRFSSSEAAASGLLGAANAAYFGARAVSEGERARRAGLLALVLVNLALAAESALYLALLPGSSDSFELVSTLFVRTALLAAVATFSR